MSGGGKQELRQGEKCHRGAEGGAAEANPITAWLIYIFCISWCISREVIYCEFFKDKGMRKTICSQNIQYFTHTPYIQNSN